PPTPPLFPYTTLFRSLAAGARGLTWYTYYDKGYHYAPINDAGHRTASWSYLKMVNDQVKALGPLMNRLTSTGVYFSAPPLDASRSEERRVGKECRVVR